MGEGLNNDGENLEKNKNKVADVDRHTSQGSLAVAIKRHKSKGKLC